MMTGVMAVRPTKDTEDAEEGATTKTERRGCVCVDKSLGRLILP